MKWFVPILLACLAPSCTRPADVLHQKERHSSTDAAEKHVKNASYRVRGKKYYPMSVRDALRYKETGYASMYGRSSRRVKTSSGEYVNPQTSMSAAHRTLPMPCKVKVTCLATGKSVVVRVNNRGPFYDSRVIDLTSAAARQIGLHGRGIGKVRLEVVSVGDGPYEIFAR